MAVTFLLKALKNSWKATKYLKSPAKTAVNKLRYDKPLFNYIGKGHEGSVYKFTDSNIAFKVKDSKDLKDIFIKSFNMNVSAQDKVNHVIGSIGDKVKVMKYINGKPIDAKISVKDLSVKSIREYMTDLYKATQNGMRHDFGGQNTLFDVASQKLTPIDFLPKIAGQKSAILNNTFIQLAPTVKTSKDANELVSKISLAFLESLKSNSMTKSGLRSITVDFKTAKDLMKMNPKLRESLDLTITIENKLKSIMQNKGLEGISPEIKKEVALQIELFEKELMQYI